MADDVPFYKPDRKPPSPRQATPGELLFEFVRHDGGRMRCELRDHGEFGVEAQFLLNGTLYIARTFQGINEHGIAARAIAVLGVSRARAIAGSTTER